MNVAPDHTKDSYYRARYFDPAVGRFLGEDPAFVAGGLNLYDYARNSPTRFADPSGLSAVENAISTHLTMMWASHCPPGAAGACTILSSDVDCTCSKFDCSDSDWKLSLTLRIKGDMWIYNGPWSVLPLKPKDSSIRDSKSAIQHEYGVHINPAIAAATAVMDALESNSYGTEAQCQADCAIAKASVPAAPFERSCEPPRLRRTPNDPHYNHIPCYCLRNGRMG